MSFFWAGQGTWLGYLTCVLGILAQAEQLVIALTLHSWQTDVESLCQVFRRQSPRV
ncbi:MAG: hypothetical protein ACM3ZA_10585 [Bacillota bacterium]